MRIIIKLPDKDKWKLTLNGGTRGKNSANAVYNRIEHFLMKLSNCLGTDLKEKTTIVMKTSKGTTFNQSLSSNDSRYLLFTTACFMEDFLSKVMLNRKYKLYG